MLPSGTRLGPYEVLGLIGEGGMGQVYRAADTRLDRAVAIKVMPAALADDKIRRERFEREARSISRLVHRDLKPGNVMLTRAGARLLDFGLARTVSPATGADATAGDRTSLTTQGTLLGTLHYMAPEQLDGREVDTRADIFAFGAVLYEMITGLKAFEAESPARVLSAILRDEPARVSTIVPVTPTGLDDLIHTCLEKDPNERWQGMSDVARQLRWLQSALSSAKSG